MFLTPYLATEFRLEVGITCYERRGLLPKPPRTRLAIACSRPKPPAGLDSLNVRRIWDSLSKRFGKLADGICICAVAKNAERTNATSVKSM